MRNAIRLLCTEADRERLRPVLNALHGKGMRVSDARNARKNDIVLAALPELRCVTVSADMEQAVGSLLGKEVRFELVIAE